MFFNSVSNLIPRPFREIVQTPFNIYSLKKERTPSQIVDDILYSEEGEAAIKQANQMLYAALRLGFIALGWFISESLHWSLKTTFALGFISSTPMVMIASGTYAFSSGARLVLNAVRISSIWQFNTGLGLVGIGCLLLEYHDAYRTRFFDLGLIDKSIRKIAEERGLSFTKTILSLPF